MSIPSDRSFTEEHEWARVEGERVRVGITDYAQGQLGTVVYLDFTSIGTAVEAGDVLAEIESTKAVSEVYAPVAGTVVEVNTSLVDHPEYVNDEPYDEVNRACGGASFRRPMTAPGHRQPAGLPRVDDATRRSSSVPIIASVLFTRGCTDSCWAGRASISLPSRSAQPGDARATYQESPTISPFSLRSMSKAAGLEESPGIVDMSPQIG
jgi:glycine cleavage system H protein